MSFLFIPAAMAALAALTPAQAMIASAAVAAGAQLLGSGLSYSQAAQQKKYMKEAEAEAAKAAAAARAKLQEAPLERLQVPTEAYDTAMREITAQSMQMTEAAREAGARELAASVGRLGAMGLTATQQQRQDMAQDIYKRDVAVAEDEARRLGLLSGLDVKETMGAQLAAAQAQKQAAQATTSATQGVVGAIGTMGNAMPLYFSTQAAQAGQQAAEGIGGAMGQMGGGQLGQAIGPQLGALSPNQPANFPNITLNQVSQSTDPYMMYLMSQYTK